MLPAAIFIFYSSSPLSSYLPLASAHFFSLFTSCTGPPFTTYLLLAQVHFSLDLLPTWTRLSLLKCTPPLYIFRKKIFSHYFVIITYKMLKAYTKLQIFKILIAHLQNFLSFSTPRRYLMSKQNIPYTRGCFDYAQHDNKYEFSFHLRRPLFALKKCNTLRANKGSRLRSRLRGLFNSSTVIPSLSKHPPVQSRTFIFPLKAPFSKGSCPPNIGGLRGFSN